MQRMPYIWVFTCSCKHTLSWWYDLFNSLQWPGTLPYYPWNSSLIRYADCMMFPLAPISLCLHLSVTLFHPFPSFLWPGNASFFSFPSTCLLTLLCLTSLCLGLAIISLDATISQFHSTLGWWDLRLFFACKLCTFGAKGKQHKRRMSRICVYRGCFSTGLLILAQKATEGWCGIMVRSAGLETWDDWAGLGPGITGISQSALEACQVSLGLSQSLILIYLINLLWGLNISGGK